MGKIIVKNIVFVCLGNIIRSPLAEHVLKRIVAEAGKSDEYSIESAGTSVYHVGESPDNRMRGVSAERGLTYTGKSQHFVSEFYERFDLVIAMDQSNLRNILSLSNTQSDRDKVITMRTYDPEGDATMDVPDPYYGGIDGFHAVYDIVYRSCEELFSSLETKK